MSIYSKQLVGHVANLRREVDEIGLALENGQTRPELLMLLAAVHNGINRLIAEMLEVRIRLLISLGDDHSVSSADLAETLTSTLRTYLK